MSGFIVLLYCSCLQDQPDLNKNWVGKRIYPAHGGTINLVLPDGKEVEWPLSEGKALGSKGQYVELRYKKVVALVRMLEVVHEDRAMEYFTSKIADEPNRFFWKYMHAMVLAKEDSDDARKYLDKYVALNPSCEMQCLAANYYYQRMEYDRSLTLLDNALFLAPALFKRLSERNFDDDLETQKAWFCSAFRLRSLIYLERQEREKAQADLAACLKLVPTSSETHAILAKLAFDNKHYDEALTEVDRALAANDEVPIYYLLRTVILLAQNKVQAAMDELPNCLNRNDLDAFDLLAASWLLASHPNDAIRDGRISLMLAKRAMSMNQAKDKLYQATLAAAYAESGDFAHAVQCQKDALASPRGQQHYKDILQHQLALYQQGKPYRWRTMEYRGNNMPGWK